MTTELINPEDRFPKKNGLTPLLRTLLTSSELARHKAMVAFELEVLSKKLDRYGWDRDRGTPAQNRMITDWADALCDYTLDEIRTACKAAVLARPDKMPNEGHVLAQITKARAVSLAKHRAANPEPEPELRRVSPDMAEKARQILAEVFGDKGSNDGCIICPECGMSGPCAWLDCRHPIASKEGE